MRNIGRSAFAMVSAWHTRRGAPSWCVFVATLALLAVPCVHGGVLRPMDVSSIVSGLDVTQITWYGDKLFLIDGAGSTVRRYAVGADGSFSGQRTWSSSNFAEYDDNEGVVATSASTLLGCSPQYRCFLQSGTSVDCSRMGEDNKDRQGYIKYVFHAAEDGYAWQFQRSDGNDEWNVQWAKSDGGVDQTIDYFGKMTKKLKGMACSPGGECIWTSDESGCGFIHGFLWSSSDKLMKMLDGSDIPSNGDSYCGKPEFDPHVAGEVLTDKPAFQFACGPSLFVDAKTSSYNHVLLQISAQSLRDCGSCTTITATLHTDITSSKDLGLGCLDGQLVVSTLTTVSVYAIPTALSIQHVASATTGVTDMKGWYIAPFHARVFAFLDYQNDVLYSYELLPSIESDGASVTCTTNEETGASACEVTRTDAADFTIPLRIKYSAPATASVDASGTSGMSFAVSESAADGTISMSVQVTSITDPKPVSVTVSITDTGSSTVVASATVTVTFERAELVVSSPAPKSVPFGDTTFSTLTVSNAATSAVTLDATVTADSTAAWGALKDPATNQDTASVALSLAPGDSQTLTVSLRADKLGVQEYTLEITSNDFLNPSASVVITIIGTPARMLAMFPLHPSNTSQALLEHGPELRPGALSSTHTLSFVNLVSEAVTVSLDVPNLPWLRALSGDTVTIDGGQIKSVVFQFFHAESAVSPLALGKHTATIDVTARRPGAAEGWGVEATFTAIAGFVDPPKCTLRYGAAASASPPTDAIVGEALEIRVELRDHLGNPATQAATGDVRLDDVKATLLRTVDGSVVKVVNVAAETTTLADDTTVVVLKVYPRVKGTTELQVTVFGEAVQGGATVTLPVAPRACVDVNSVVSADGSTCHCVAGYAPTNLNLAPLTPTCLRCPGGTVKPLKGNQECKACSSGTYGMIPDQPCTPCAPNSVSQEGYVLCTWCGDFETTGRAPNRAADECLCAPGWYINGTVGALAECAHCPPGTVQSEFHRESCTPCPANTYPAPNRTLCLACPSQTVSAKGWDECLSCPSGQYVDLSKRKCRKCEPGFASDAVDATSCAPCGDGTVAFGAGNTQCTNCPAGTRHEKGQNECVPCIAGTFSPEGDTVCTTCPTGSITVDAYFDVDGVRNSLGLPAGASNCTVCPAGTFAVRSVECRKCPFNQYSDAGATSCTPCPTGTWSQDGLTCHGCPPGTFQPGPGKECAPCPSGQASNVWNVTTCTECPAFTVPIADRSECAACKPGTFALENVECRPCGVGTYNLDPFALECTKCPVGHVARTLGNSLCEPCDEGFFAAATGSDTCTPCPANSFSSAGADECIACPEGGGSDGAGVSCSGGSVKFQPGFWRPTELQADGVAPDTVFFKCPEGACITDESRGNVSCAVGHTGPLCSVCEPGYAPAGALCSRCWREGLSWSATVAAIAVLVALLVFMVVRSTGRRSELMAIGRIFLNWVQLTSAIGTFALKAPALAKDMLNLSTASDGISLNAFFVQCAVGFSYYSLFFSYCLFPAVSVALIGVACTVGYYVQVARLRPQGSALRRLKRKFSDYFKLASTVLVVVTYVKVSREILGVFEVFTPAINGVLYIKADMSAEAFTAEHWMAMVIGACMVVVFVLGVPGSAVLMLSKAKRKILSNSATFRRKYGFLYDGYDAERGWYWWESVVMLRKVLVTAIAVFLDDSFMQVYAATILLTVALVAQAYVSPFTSDLHNNLELLSLVASQVTQMGSIMYWRFPSQSTLLTVVLIGFNVVTAATFVFTMVYVARTQVLSKTKLAGTVLARFTKHKRRGSRRGMRDVIGGAGGIDLARLRSAGAVKTNKLAVLMRKARRNGDSNGTGANGSGAASQRGKGAPRGRRHGGMARRVRSSELMWRAVAGSQSTDEVQQALEDARRFKSAGNMRRASAVSNGSGGTKRRVKRRSSAMFMSNPMFGGDPSGRVCRDSDDSSLSDNEPIDSFQVVPEGSDDVFDARGDSYATGVVSPASEQRLQQLAGVAEEGAIKTARLVRTESYRARKNPLRTLRGSGRSAQSRGRAAARGRKARFSPTRRGR